MDEEKSFSKGDVVEFNFGEANEGKGQGIIIRCFDDNYYDILVEGEFNNHRLHISLISQMSDLNIFSLLNERLKDEK